MYEPRWFLSRFCHLYGGDSLLYSAVLLHRPLKGETGQSFRPEVPVGNAPMFTMRDAMLAALCNGVLYGCFKRGGINEGEGEVGGFCVFKE